MAIVYLPLHILITEFHVILLAEQLTRNKEGIPDVER